MDRVLVGVATLRTLRELIRQQSEMADRPPRAWDLALWNGVSAQGAANSLQRLHQAGLVTALRPTRPGRAPAYRLVGTHPLVPPLARLFEAERTMLPVRPTWRRGEPGPPVRGRRAAGGEQAEGGES